MSRTDYFLLRFPAALSFLGHGLVRLPKIQGFSKWMTGAMEKSYLPKDLILCFSYTVPFVETIIGALLLTGIFTRQAIYAGLVLMAIFIFGDTTIENWEPITTQMLHALYLGALLYLLRHNEISAANSIGTKKF